MAKLFKNKLLMSLSDRYPAVARGLGHTESGLLSGLLGASGLLPIERASDLGAIVGRMVGRSVRKNQQVKANLRMLFPEASDEFIAKTAMGVWAQIGRVVAEYPHLQTIIREQRVELVLHCDPDTLKRGKGFMFAAMHQANWNLPLLGGILGGFPLSAIYQEQKNKGVERLVAKWRDAMPCPLIPVEQTVKRSIEEIRAGRNVGLFVDHRIDEGELVPFGPQPAPTTIVPARIVAKLGSGLIPARLERLPGVRFRLSLYEPVMAPPGIDDPKDVAVAMMTEVNKQFVSWIREQPEDWCTAVKLRWSKPVIKDAIAGTAQAAI